MITNITKEFYEKTLETNGYLTDEQKEELFGKDNNVYGAKACKEGNNYYTVHYFKLGKKEEPAKLTERKQDDYDIEKHQIRWEGF